MHSPISLFNWSLKKTLRQIGDPIVKARIIVFYFVFLMNFLKIGALLLAYAVNHQSILLARCVISTLVTVISLKLLLSKPQHLDKLVHFALFSSILAIWSAQVFRHQSLDLIVLQNVFMICMWSFYGLTGWWGLIYSTAAAIPLIVSFLTNQSASLALASPQMTTGSSLLIILLNFIIIFLGHYYYRNILYQTMDMSAKLNDELKKANTAKTLFFSSMSHELRNPLNTVIGMANLLKEENKDPGQNENLEILKFSAESLLLLINDILDFNKIGSGKVKLESIPFQLRKLLENACAGLRIEAVEKGLSFKIAINEESGPLHLLGDPTRLLQIIYNLVGNAIKFTDKGGVEISVNVISRIENSLLLRFVIQDTGLGISKEEQQHIFDPFTQASSTTTRQFGGTGLGLGIVKQLLKLHQSTIHLESEINAGAKFYFDINYPEAQQLPELQQGQPKHKVEAQLIMMNVLLAEDNPMNALFVKKLFERWGIPLTVAADGAEVIRLLNEYDYDLILMDIHMPVLNGYETTLKIREMENERKANCYIIALTGSVSEEIFSTITEGGMNDVLLKPFQQEELYQKLKNFYLIRSGLPV